jgi:hypothetical protein
MGTLALKTTTVSLGVTAAITVAEPVRASTFTAGSPANAVPPMRSARNENRQKGDRLVKSPPEAAGYWRESCACMMRMIHVVAILFHHLDDLRPGWSTVLAPSGLGRAEAGRA